MRRLSLVDRLEKLSVVDPETGCHIFMGQERGGHPGDRYGGMKVDGVSEYAHRVSYMEHHGSIPDGLIVMHTCDVRKCVNPDHLVLGTHMLNALDRDQKGRGLRGRSMGARTK